MASSSRRVRRPFETTLIVCAFVASILTGWSGRAAAGLPPQTPLHVTAATGGIAISARTAWSGIAPSWTALSGPAFTEVSPGDLTGGYPEGSIFVAIPAGFQLEVPASPGGPGTVQVSLSPSACALTATVTQTDTQIAIVIQNGPSAVECTLTLAGLQVQPRNVSPLANGQLSLFSATAGISFDTLDWGALVEFASGPQRTVSGQVRYQGAGVKDVTVRIDNAAGGAVFATTTTDLAGNYSAAVPDGFGAAVIFNPPSQSLAVQVYDHQRTIATRTLAVVDGADATGIDADLADAYLVSGHLVNNGTPIAGAEVLAYKGEPISCCYLVRSGQTDASGGYELGLAPGTYRVRFMTATCDEWYDHVAGTPDVYQSWLAATPVVVGTTPVSNIDGSCSSIAAGRVDLAVTQSFAYASTNPPTPPVTGGSVTFEVTLTNNIPTVATNVHLSERITAGSGAIKAVWFSGSLCPGTAGTTADCAIGQVAQGANLSAFVDVTPIGPGTITIEASISGTEPDLNPANNTANATSPQVQQGYAIRGHVTLRGVPLLAVSVRVFSPSNPGQLTTTWSDANGDYGVQVPNGVYFLLFEQAAQPSLTAAADAWYRNRLDPQLADPVTVSNGDVAGIDVDLLPASLVSGRVTDVTGAPVTGAEVYAYLAGTFSSCCGFAREGLTDGSGDYALPLADGTYHLWIRAAGFKDQWYPGVSAALFSDGWQLADDVRVAGVDRTGFDVVLATGNTTTGPVKIKPLDPTTGDSPVTITFSNVTVAGNSTVQTSGTGPTSPSGFTLDGTTYYDIKTTATFSGTVTVCIDSPSVTTSSRLLHYEGGTWKDHTDLPVVPQTICATTTSLSPFGIFSDRTPPTLTITSPTGDHVLGEAVVARYACSDAGSGLAGCVGTTASGSSIDTSHTGSFTFAVDASDRAGNKAHADATFRITYGVCLLTDLARPVQPGRTLPIKLALCDNAGKDVSSADRTVTAARIDGAPARSSGNANTGERFRFDPTLGTSGGYLYNLSTVGLAAGHHTLVVGVSGDPMEHAIGFDMR